MITSEDSRHTVDIGEYYIIKPDMALFDYRGAFAGSPVAEGFSYSSDTNGQWLTVAQLRATLAEQGFDVSPTGRQ